MTASRWALSLFLIFHLTSIGLASLPPGVRPSSVGSPRHPTDDPIARVVTPVVDRGAQVAAGLAATILRTMRPIRLLTDLYVETVGLGQTWNMFSRPWTEHRYARLRYYVASSTAQVHGTAPTWMATEMVFPALRVDGRLNLLRAYGAFAWDKVFLSSMEASLRERSKTEVPSALVPVVRYYTKRYEREHLVPGERIVRIEVWLGRAPVRSRGSGQHPEAHRARSHSLIESYAGSVEESVGLGSYPPLNAIQMQEDIVWQLRYFDEK